jgi:hypothetical protein
VTAAIALSLGVAGAIGSATGSIHSFGLGVFHVVQQPKSQPTSVTPDWSGKHDPKIPAWGWEYGFKVPICWNGHIKLVPVSELFWYFTHGGKPFWFCFKLR